VRWRTVKPARCSPGLERRSGDDGKAAAVEELDGGGARAHRREESGDGCSKDRARASAFYRGQREVEVATKGGVAAEMVPFIAAITISEGGGNAAELSREEESHNPVKVGARLVQFLAMVQEVASSLARHGDVRWVAVHSVDAGKVKVREGGAGLVGRLAC
jgi:hypothetical protein